MGGKRKYENFLLYQEASDFMKELKKQGCIDINVMEIDDETH